MNRMIWISRSSYLLITFSSLSNPLPSSFPRHAIAEWLSEHLNRQSGSCCTVIAFKLKCPIITGISMCYLACCPSLIKLLIKITVGNKKSFVYIAFTIIRRFRQHVHWILKERECDPHDNVTYRQTHALWKCNTSVWSRLSFDITTIGLFFNFVFSGISYCFIQWISQIYLFISHRLQHIFKLDSACNLIK